MKERIEFHRAEDWIRKDLSNDAFRWGVVRDQNFGVFYNNGRWVSCSLTMLRRNEALKTFLDKWPGKRLFGIFRFLPIFFCMGAALEYSMINWDFKGQVNFYRTYKKKQIQEKIEELIIEEKLPVP